MKEICFDKNQLSAIIKTNLLLITSGHYSINVFELLGNRTKKRMMQATHIDNNPS